MTSSPSESDAVTVTVAVPAATAPIARPSPSTLAVATPVSEDCAAKERGSPSGSVKCADRPSNNSLSTASSMSGSASRTRGARFGTLTRKLCSAVSPSVSVAVTVTRASPLPTPLSATWSPATLAATREASDDSTAKVSSSPSGSVKWEAGSTRTTSPTVTSTSGSACDASGARLGTITENVRLTVSPSESAAVTSIVAVPLATAATVNSSPETVAVATAGENEAAVKTSVSSSGSVKCSDTSSTASLPTSTSMSAMASATTGARFGTMTANSCTASNPPGSVAMTVIIVVPLAMAPTVISTPETPTAATSSFDETTVKSSSSPSGSVKYPVRSAVVSPPTSITRSGSVSARRGARLGTVMVKSCATDRPSGSVAVTVIAATPGRIARTVISSALVVTVATPALEEAAAKVSESPSGSVKWPETRVTSWSPASASPSGSGPATSGARFGTVTAKVCVTDAPSGSMALTVTVVEPETTA